MRARTYHAACLCGAVRYVADAVPRLATPCICPRCRGQGVRLVPVEPESFALLAGEDMLTEEIATARRPHHFYCRRCGEVVFGIVALPGQARRVTANAACLGRGDVEALAVPAREVRRPKKWEI